MIGHCGAGTILPRYVRRQRLWHFTFCPSRLGHGTFSVFSVLSSDSMLWTVDDCMAFHCKLSLCNTPQNRCSSDTGLNCWRNRSQKSESMVFLPLLPPHRLYGKLMLSCHPKTMSRKSNKKITGPNLSYSRCRTMSSNCQLFMVPF
jgi:hypothetical protein